MYKYALVVVVVVVNLSSMKIAIMKSVPMGRHVTLCYFCALHMHRTSTTPPERSRGGADCSAVALR